MAKRLRDNKTGKIAAIEFSAAELGEVLAVEADDLARWEQAFPPFSGRGEDAVYRVYTMDELAIWRKRAAVLRTRMSEAAVANVEEAGLLDSYAKLAEDCPTGVTAHVWRSYGLVVLMQSRYGQMIGPEELAERASLTEIDPDSGKPVASVDLAAKHIRLLQALNLLTQVEGRWEHQGLPKSWRGA